MTLIIRRTRIKQQQLLIELKKKACHLIFKKIEHKQNRPQLSLYSDFLVINKNNVLNNYKNKCYSMNNYVRLLVIGYVRVRVDDVYW